MRRVVFSIVLCLLMVGLASCNVADVSLSEPDAAVTDESLCGVWHSVIENNNVYLHIIPLEKPLLKLIRVIHLHVGGSYNLDEFVMFPTIAEGKRFLNIEVPVQRAEGNENHQTEMDYHFVKYERSKTGVLTVLFLSNEAWKKAIADQQIAGKAWDTTWASNIRVNAKRADLLKFLLSPEAEKEFRVYGEFRKVQVSEQSSLR